MDFLVLFKKQNNFFLSKKTTGSQLPSPILLRESKFSFQPRFLSEFSSMCIALILDISRS